MAELRVGWELHLPLLPLPVGWGLNSKVKLPGVLWAVGGVLPSLGYVGIHGHKQFRMNVSHGIFPSWLGEADPDLWCVCGQF